MSRRRGSSIGKFELGDTSPSLTTMNTTKHQRKKSIERMAEISSEISSDKQILSKIWVSYIELSYRQTWINPFLVLVLTITTYWISNPDSALHQFLAKCIVPSYHIEGTNQYGKGGNDFYFVAYYAIFFTFTREFIMCVFLRPLAIYFGLSKQEKIKRFMEQTYAIVYFGFTSPFGLWIMSKLPIWFFQTTPLYESYPHKTHDLYFKVYYLGQAAYWLQQFVILVLQLEKPRKDYYELVFHHIVSIALIWNSYRFHFTWMGLQIFITMDVSDFFLGLSKTLNYIGLPLSEPFFLVFVFVWIYLRHYINLKILWSVLTEFKTVGPWELNWITQQYKCYISQPIVFTLIGALQLVNLFWLFFVLRIAYRFLKGEAPKDDRSDSEDEDEEEFEMESQKTQ